jgi:hypothetical protein
LDIIHQSWNSAAVAVASVIIMATIIKKWRKGEAATILIITLGA